MTQDQIHHEKEEGRQNHHQEDHGGRLQSLAARRPRDFSNFLPNLAQELDRRR
jgi:hypothetical protein